MTARSLGKVHRPSLHIAARNVEAREVAVNHGEYFHLSVGHVIGLRGMCLQW